MFLLLADLIVVVHLGFILFASLGGLLLFKWPRLAWLHLPAVAWGAITEFMGLICPLTPLEIWLRRHAGADPYSGGFISHYLVPLIYPPGLTPSIQWLLGGILIALNLLIYGWLIWTKHRQAKIS
jgi:hypothetical protein